MIPDYSLRRKTEIVFEKRKRNVKPLKAVICEFSHFCVLLAYFFAIGKQIVFSQDSHTYNSLHSH